MFHNFEGNSGPSHEPNGDDNEDHGFCRSLFNLIRELFNALQLSGRISNPNSDEAFLAQNEAGRFHLWGDGFDVNDGGLDELLDGSGLYGAVVVQLAGIARKLRRYVDRNTELFRNLESTLESAEFLFPEAIEEEDEELDLLETLEDIVVLNDGLYNLTPFLETIPIEYETEIDNLRSATAGAEEITETKALQINILDKFPDADNPGLVSRLAELNLQRKKQLWELKDKHEKMLEPLRGGGGLGPDTPSSYAPSTRYSDLTRGSSAPSMADSLFHFSEYSQSEASQSSFASVDLDIVGRTRIPPPPVRLDGDVIFECNLCFQTLHGVQTKYSWKKHVFKDLRPYSCSFLPCPLPATHLFNSRTEWVDHEFAVHRTIFSWVCIKDCGQEFQDPKVFRDHLQGAHLDISVTDSELADIVKRCERRNPLPEGQTTICPLCRSVVPETKRSIRRHLGRHMEEISLAVVPPENYNLEWEEGSEDDDEVSSSEDGEVDGGSEYDSFMGELSVIHQETKGTITKVVDSCLKYTIDHDTGLLETYDEPIWRSELFGLVEAYDSGGKCLELFTDELRREAWTQVDGEPDVARRRGDVASLADYNSFLSESLYDEVQRRLKLRSYVLGFKQCHNCKEISPPGKETCPRCRHSHCDNCSRQFLPPSLRAQVLEQLREAILPLMKSKKPMSESQSGVGPSASPFINFSAAPPTWGEAMEDPNDQYNLELLAANDGFQVIGRSSRNPRRSPSIYSGSADGTEIHGHLVTRTVVVDKKYYPLLIGSGGATLSDIIVDSGGPTQKSEQSRMVRFPRRDSPSNRVILNGSPVIVDGIMERIRGKVAEFDATKPSWNEIAGKGAVKERHEGGLDSSGGGLRLGLGIVQKTGEIVERRGEEWEEWEAQRAATGKENAGPSRPTITVGRSPTFNNGRDPELGETPLEDVLEGADYTEPEPRTTKSARRRHRKKKANVALRAGDP